MTGSTRPSLSTSRLRKLAALSTLRQTPELASEVAPTSAHLPPEPIRTPTLINCVAYENGLKLADVPVDRISEYLARPNCFVWVALLDAGPAELAQMQQEFGLHELAVEDAHHGHQRPKIEEYGESLFVVMHLVELVAGELHVGEVDVFVGPNYVLSVRSRSQQGFLGVRQRCEREPELLEQGPAFVLYALMDAVVDRYFPIIDSFETELETLESRIFSKAQGEARGNIERLYECKRKLMVLKHAVAPLSDAMNRLHGGRTPSICSATQHYFRDVGDHLARIDNTIDTIREMISTAMAVNLAMVTIEESDTTKKLAAWAGIFAAATAFAGVWGMNFKFMPELDWPFGYPLALSVIGGTCLLLWWRFRKVGWL